MEIIKVKYNFFYGIQKLEFNCFSRCHFIHYGIEVEQWIGIRFGMGEIH